MIKPPSNFTLPCSCLCSWLWCFDEDPGGDQRELTDATSGMSLNSLIAQISTYGEPKINTIAAIISSCILDFWIWVPYLALSQGLPSVVVLKNLQKGGRIIHNTGFVWQRKGRLQKREESLICILISLFFNKVLRVWIQASIAATNTFTTLLLVHFSSYRLHSWQVSISTVIFHRQQ